MVVSRHHFKIIRYKYHQKLCREKVLAPPTCSSPLPRWARGHCRYPADRVPLCTRLKRSAPMATDLFPVPGGSSSATCPEAQSMPPARRGIRCHHMPHGTERTTRQKRALVSSCASRHREHHSHGEGSRCCHVTRGTEPVTRQEKAPESPRASWLQARPLRKEALASPRGRGTRSTAWQVFGTGTCHVALDPPPATCPVALGPGHTRAFPRRLTHHDLARHAVQATH
jgi:hypothetical protein